MFSTVAPLSTGERGELLEDIKQNGIKIPILVDRKKTTILDGLTRWRIAHDLKLKPGAIPMEVFKGKDESIPAEILSRNVHRRHLSDDQRAALVSKIRGPELEKEAKDRQSAGGGDKRSTAYVENSVTGRAAGSFGKKEGVQGSVAEKIATEAGTTIHKAKMAEKARKGGLLDDVVAGKEKLAKAAKKAGKSKRKPAKKKEIPFADVVFKKWTQWINRFSPPDRQNVMVMVKEWCTLGK